jgi:hypothetical protein
VNDGPDFQPIPDIPAISMQRGLVALRLAVCAVRARLLGQFVICLLTVYGKAYGIEWFTQFALLSFPSIVRQTLKAVTALPQSQSRLSCQENIIENFHQTLMAL